jgi:hypothetical protein
MSFIPGSGGGNGGGFETVAGVQTVEGVQGIFAETDEFGNVKVSNEGVVSIQNGTGITVNNTDPQNPIISATSIAITSSRTVSYTFGAPNGFIGGGMISPSPSNLFVPANWLPASSGINIIMAELSISVRAQTTSSQFNIDGDGISQVGIQFTDVNGNTSLGTAVYSNQLPVPGVAYVNGEVGTGVNTLINYTFYLERGVHWSGVAGDRFQVFFNGGFNWAYALGNRQKNNLGFALGLTLYGSP